jgi:hypothetical protein
LFSFENRKIELQKEQKKKAICSLSHLQDGKGGWFVYIVQDAESSLQPTISFVDNRSTPLKQPVKKVCRI